MNKKVLIYVVLALIVIVAGFAVVMYKQKCAGLATGTPSVEDKIKANLGRGGQFAEDAG